MALSSRLMRPWSDKGFVEATLHLQKVMQVGEMISTKTPQGAEAGVMFAESRLGNLYAIGKGVAKDYNKAIELLNRAAAKGSVYAQNRLEEIYREMQTGRA